MHDTQQNNNNMMAKRQLQRDGGRKGRLIF